MKHPSILLVSALLACSGGGSSKVKESGTATGSTTGTPAGGTSTGSTTVTIPATEHRNLLILSIDTLRKDHISRFDPENRDLTPFLDSLMDEGVVAERHHTGSNWTFHSFSTALSGRYPVEEQVLPRVVPADHNGWPEGSRFLADELGDQGFTSVLASANGWLGPQYGLSVGYDAYLGNAFDQATTTFDLGSGELQARLDAGGVERWHLHLHFLEPHAPFIPPAEYRVGEDQLDPIPWDLDTQPAHYDTVNLYPNMTPEEQALLEAHMRVRYEGEVRWIDAMIADMWADMDARGWLDDTLVVFFTDHGEQFWEHGNQSHAFHLYPEETEGTFFLWSRKLEAQSVELRTSGVDIAPTAFRHLGLEAPAEWTGHALSEIPLDRPVYSDTNGRLGAGHAVTKGNRELIYLWNGTAAYYHLDTDPERAINRFDPMDEGVHELWDLVVPRVELSRDEAPAQTPLEPPGLNF